MSTNPYGVRILFLFIPLYTLLGESNNEHGVEYKCSQKAMIDDWRNKFSTDSGTSNEFPFGLVQVFNGHH